LSYSFDQIQHGGLHGLPLRRPRIDQLEMAGAGRFDQAGVVASRGGGG
jgi:hypothetical protein